MNGSREAIAQFAEEWAVPLSEALQVAVAVPSSLFAAPG